MGYGVHLEVGFVLGLSPGLIINCDFENIWWALSCFFFRFCTTQFLYCMICFFFFVSGDLCFFFVWLVVSSLDSWGVGFLYYCGCVIVELIVGGLVCCLAVFLVDN